MREARAADVSDTGCDLHLEGCLTCPLPRCRYDPGGVREILRQERARSVAEAAMRGGSVAEVCQQFQISRRTFFRDKALARSPVLAEAV